MGVSDNMLHKETLKVASGSHSEGRLGRVSTENGHFASAPKYKQRKVSAVRDFPPGCGRLAAPINRPSEQAQWQVLSEKENPALVSDRADKIECERRFKISGLQKELPQENVATFKEEVVPQSGVKSHRGESSLEKTSARNYRPRRGVTAVRDFPPFCGRNAPPLSEEERTKWLTSLKNKFNLEKFVNVEKPSEETICTDVKQVIEDVQDVNALEGKIGGSAPILSAEEIQSKPEELASEKMRKQGAYEASSRNDMDEDKEDMREKSIKSPCETYPNEFNSKSKQVSETSNGYIRGLEENPMRDIVIYAEDKSFETKLSDSPAFEDQLLEEDCGSQEVLLDGSIVQGLMASSTCPLPQGKETCKLDLEGVSFKRKRKNNFILLPRANHALVANKNEAESPEETCIKKNSSPTRPYTNDNFGLRSYSYDVSLPPSCPSSVGHDNDAINTRNKVRETLRLFQAICRKLLQEEESKLNGEGKTFKRVDIQAAKILKEKGKYINTGKQIIGPVPGVEVGDEFHYFVELNIVGLHRLSQGGIDYVKQGDRTIAISVIASGGYENDLDNSDGLTYMGQGGNVMQKGKQPEDQKLERGNLALANSIFVRNPVRVIRGETRSSDFLEGRGKTYVYDGLYLVEKYKQESGPHGKLVYKFKLVRIPGQPELAWKVVKKSNKSKVREGLCAHDISQRKEVIPICAINTIDSEKPPPFVYVAHMIYPDWCHPIPLKGCDCIDGCSESGKCSCAMKNGGEIPYNHNGAIVEAKPLVYECGPSCKCPASCYNRVSQRGIKFQLEIFKTESRGWGVRSLNSIPSGSFICEYAGELLEDREAEERTGNDEYLFDIGNNYSESSLWDGLSTLMPDAHSSVCQVVQDSGFTIDAAQHGNIGRFINHSCSPNLYAQNVLYDHDDRRIPHIMLFAAENIPPLQELTYHYNYMIDQVRDENGNIKKKFCYCGSSECTGRLY
ncbi:histone-lysine N-methyltransferase, H3 lysine-9 specific SUVH6 [Herrania umbratica]|uniref:Histone-lysine N-methyltransferase, H3 lysine-9 specific SUVH6 n=1 Tax=Herrania umbratica TaxID=108875 RepID=A0A6J1AWH1_9ROSI|nr:histone-lysine N-methyltransferase, H3 lysine-9 specific SUVH6 [Herrania umbratica]